MLNCTHRQHGVAQRHPNAPTRDPGPVARMTIPVRQLTSIVAELCSQAQTLLPRGQAELAQAFLSQYYHRVPSEVLAESDLPDLYGAAIAHWDLGRQRKAESSLVKVYTPTHESHGWESTHTVVEIITNDRAFLVDSIAMVLNGHNLTIHLTIHPVIRTVRDSDCLLYTSPSPRD